MNHNHASLPSDYETCDICGYDHSYDFPYLTDGQMKHVEMAHLPPRKEIVKMSRILSPRSESEVASLRKIVHSTIWSGRMTYYFGSDTTLRTIHGLESVMSAAEEQIKIERLTHNYSPMLIDNREHYFIVSEDESFSGYEAQNTLGVLTESFPF